MDDRPKTPARSPWARWRPRMALALIVLLSVTGALQGEVPWSPTPPPRTDGEGLPPPPPRPDLADLPGRFAAARAACEGPCVTPYGQVLGTAGGAEARSNCVSTCVRPAFYFLDLPTGAVSVGDRPTPENGRQYVGIAYQCVAYARYWWLKNLSLTFGDVDTAHHILYLTEGTDPRTGTPVPLGRSLNGTARRPPQRGDLVIYGADPTDPDWRAGHVAVVVDQDRGQGLVALAEANYDNRPWQEPAAFARQVQLFEINGRYTLLDVPTGARRNPHGGRILGWVYPAP